MNKSLLILCCFFALNMVVPNPNSAVLGQTYPAPWPTPDSTWIEYTILGSSLTDYANGDCEKSDPTNGGSGVNPANVDVFNGCTGGAPMNLPSAYYYYDDTNDVFFFRLLLRATPSQGGGLAAKTWNVLFDLDGDGWMEFFVEVEGNAEVINLYYSNALTQEVITPECDDGEGLVWQQAITMGTHVRIVDDTATSGGYYLDWQAPLSAFDSCDGTQIVTECSTIQMNFTTSTTPQNPTLKDFVYRPGEYEIAVDKPMPGGDPFQPACPGPPDPSQDPIVAEMSHTCGGGVNYSPITLTAYTLDTYVLQPNPPGEDIIVDTIASVTFSYALFGTSTYTTIGTVTTPDTGTLNAYSIDWDTSGLSGTALYRIKVLVVDDYGNDNDLCNTMYSVPMSDCAPLLVELKNFMAVPRSNSLLLVWETVSEVDNAGFLLWRSDSEDGEYTLITQDLIPAEGGDTWGAVYTYEDATAEPGKTYYYKLEDVDYQGTGTFHGPVRGFFFEKNLFFLNPLRLLASVSSPAAF